MAFVKPRTWIAISGCFWLIVGVFLLYKGICLISLGTIRQESLCFSFAKVFGSPEEAGTEIIAAGLFIGFVKGRFILSKTVERVTKRILSIPEPIRLSTVYAPSYWILIGAMITLGMLIRFFPIPVDLRGLVDLAVGSALIHGAMLYFRNARGGYRVN